MTAKWKVFVVIAMVALVPLRALAAVTGGLCAVYYQAVSGEELVMHQHGAEDQNSSPQNDTGGSPSICDMCTACCAGASLASGLPATPSLAIGNAQRTPFFGHDPGAHLPDSLDRPPLSL